MTETLQGEWQPIETAPRDGSAILIYQAEYDVGGEREHERQKMGGIEWSGSPNRAPFDDERYAIGYWRPWGGWGNRNSSRVHPTHWMPLPSVPDRGSVLSVLPPGDPR